MSAVTAGYSLFKSTRRHSPVKANKRFETRGAATFLMPPDLLQLTGFSQEVVWGQVSEHFPEFRSKAPKKSWRWRTRLRSTVVLTVRRFVRTNPRTKLPGFKHASRCGVFRWKTRGSFFLFEACWGVSPGKKKRLKTHTVLNDQTSKRSTWIMWFPAEQHHRHEVSLGFFYICLKFFFTFASSGPQPLQHKNLLWKGVYDPWNSLE